MNSKEVAKASEQIREAMQLLLKAPASDNAIKALKLLGLANLKVIAVEAASESK